MTYISVEWKKKLELHISGQWGIIPKLKSDWHPHKTGSLQLFLENEYCTWYESTGLNVDVSHFT